jgi:hypothetical protein
MALYLYIVHVLYIYIYVYIYIYIYIRMYVLRHIKWVDRCIEALNYGQTLHMYVYIYIIHTHTYTHIYMRGCAIVDMRAMRKESRHTLFTGLLNMYQLFGQSGQQLSMHTAVNACATYLGKPTGAGTSDGACG